MLVQNDENPLRKDKNKEVNPRSKEGRTAIAKMLMRLFELWKIPPAYQLSLLGLSEGARMSLVRYRKGMPLDDNRDLLDRAGILLSIHRSLRILFPKNRETAYGWISIPNRAFNGQKPIDVIRDKGFPGLLTVKRYLDMERGR